MPNKIILDEDNSLQEKQANTKEEIADNLAIIKENLQNVSLVISSAKEIIRLTSSFAIRSELLPFIKQLISSRPNTGELYDLQSLQYTILNDYLSSVPSITIVASSYEPSHSNQFVNYFSDLVTASMSSKISAKVKTILEKLYQAYQAEISSLEVQLDTAPIGQGMPLELNLDILRQHQGLFNSIYDKVQVNMHQQQLCEYAFMLSGVKTYSG